MYKSIHKYGGGKHDILRITHLIIEPDVEHQCYVYDLFEVST